MAFTRKTEVRHISQAELIKIAEILNQPSTSPAWKKVMQIVPNELTHNEQLSDGKPKYNIQNIRSIETAGARQNNAAQIFLEEWITSGRIRPTLSHLLQLFVKSELFRAADYVAIKLLSEAPPQRPRQGPAAKIDISLPEDDDIVNGNHPNTSEIMELNRCNEVASKDIASKQLFDRSTIPDRSISEQDEIRMAAASHLSQNVTATPVQTTNGFPHRPARHRNNHSHNRISSTQSDRTPGSHFNYVPNFHLINCRPEYSDNSHMQPNNGNIPNSPIYNVPDGSVTGQQEFFAENVPRFSRFMNPSRPSSGSERPSMCPTNEEEYSNGHLPLLSELTQQFNNQSKRSTSAIQSVKQVSSTQPVPASHNFVPNFFMLKPSNDSNDDQHSQLNHVDIPNLSTLNIANGNHNNDLNATEQRESFVENIPHLSQLINPSESLDNRSPAANLNNQQDTYNGYVPHISQLLSQSLSTDQGESVDENLPHLSQLMSQSTDRPGA